VKYALYEHPTTRRFAFDRLPERFAEGDTIPVQPSEQWFNDREQAIAALPGLLNDTDDDPQADRRST
jgi:hypothetical protein